MLHKNQKSKASAGFTIIEVLIVLAIAGLILLIVFLAVPALQRNSRNTSIKNDVQNVIGGVSEYSGANNGALPTSVKSDGTGKVDYTSAASGANATSINIQGSTTVDTVTTVPTALEPGTINVVLKKKCNSTDTNSRAVSAYYSIETSSGKVIQCTDS